MIHQVSKRSNQLKGNHQLVLCTSKVAVLQFWCSECSAGDLEYLLLVLWEYTPQFFCQAFVSPFFLGGRGAYLENKQNFISNTCCLS